jgi:PAS domain S-box-containing protein
MDFLGFLAAILTGGLATGVVMHLLNKKNVDSTTKANVDVAAAQVKKIEQEIENQYVVQLEKWLDDLRDIDEEHQLALTKKEEEISNLHKQYLDSLRKLDESRLRLDRTGRAAQRLMSKMNTAYWECDGTGKLTYVNGAWTSLLGLSVEESLGNKWMQVLEPESLEEIKLAWYAAIIDLNDSPLVFYIVNPITKEKILVKFIYSNVHDVDGTVIKVIGVTIRLHNA